MKPVSLRRRVTRQLMKRLADNEHGARRNTGRILIGLLFLYFAYLFCAGDYGLLRIYRLTRQQKELDKQYYAIATEAADYSYRLRRMETDPYFVEWLARTRYGFSRPTDIIYHLKLPNSTNGHP